MNKFNQYALVITESQDQDAGLKNAILHTADKQAIISKNGQRYHVYFWRDIDDSRDLQELVASISGSKHAVVSIKNGDAVVCDKKIYDASGADVAFWDILGWTAEVTIFGDPISLIENEMEDRSGKEGKSTWEIVTCDYFSSESMLWHVDAWESKDDPIGRTIAYIDEVTGRVIYADGRAQRDTLARTVIDAKLQDICPYIRIFNGKAELTEKGKIKLKEE